MLPVVDSAFALAQKTVGSTSDSKSVIKMIILILDDEVESRQDDGDGEDALHWGGRRAGEDTPHCGSAGTTGRQAALRRRSVRSFPVYHCHRF
jgi:hypothetical protein